MTRLVWPAVLGAARSIATVYVEPTLRQVFYRLVATNVLPNNVAAYKRLSAPTAEARRDGAFPDLADHGRRIARPLAFGNADDALTWLRQAYRRDRTAGQPVAIYLGVEKDTLVAQLSSWYDDRGLPVVALRGYGSQTIADVVHRDVEQAGIPAVLLYAGDFDPTGMDIERDFVARTACWAHTVRVALTAEQVASYQLPPLPGKASDSRAASFTATYGRLVQVELEALDPTDLHALFDDAINQWWDPQAHRDVLAAERRDLDQLSD